MQSNTTRVRRLWNLALVTVAMLAFGPSLAAADYVVGASEPVVISDDVYNRTLSVVSLTGGPGGVPSDVAKSGFADDTNPADASDNNKSNVGGTDNPNKAK